MYKEIIAHARQDEKSGEWLIYSLKEHLNETSELAEVFANKIGLNQLGELLGLLHDM